MNHHPSGVVLFGPPAVGKDTITSQITRLDSRFAHFRKIKVGGGRTSGYRILSSGEIADLMTSKQILSRVERYGNQYFVDLPELARIRRVGRIPVVHTTDIRELESLTADGSWHAWCLWAPLRTVRSRLSSRRDSDRERRLDLFSATLRALGRSRPQFDRVVDTSAATPEQIAKALLSGCRNGGFDRTLPQILSDPDLVVPVVTLRNRDGTIDWGANDEYSRRASNSGCSVLVAGTTGGGTNMSPDERLRLSQLWLRNLGPGLVNLALLGESDSQLVPEGVRPVLVPQQVGIEGLEGLAADTPGCVAYSRQSLGWQLPDEVRIPDPAPFAVKLSSASVPAAKAAAAMFAGSPRIWYGRSSQGAAALRAGADAVVAAPLAAAICSPLPTSWQALLSLAREERPRSSSSTARIAELTRRLELLLAQS